VFCADDGLSCNSVDIFNVITGNWSTANLSQSRSNLEAASLPNQELAIFAGGVSSYDGPSNVVDIFNATTGNWSTAVLSVARWWLAATSLPNQGLAIFAGGRGTSSFFYCDDFREACWSVRDVGRWLCGVLSTL
jgi:hypothetical protein